MVTGLMIGIVLCAAATTFVAAWRTRSPQRLTGVRMGGLIIVFVSVVFLAARLWDLIVSLRSGGALTLPHVVDPVALVFSLILSAAAVVVTEVRRDSGPGFHRAAGSSVGVLWSRLSRALSSSPEPGTMLLDLAAAMRDSLDAQIARVYRVETHSRRVRLIGTSAARSETTLDADSGYPHAQNRAAAFARVCVSAADLQPQYIDTDGHPSLLAIPLGMGSQLDAVIIVEQPLARVDDPHVCELLRAVGSLAGRCLHDWALASRGVIDSELNRRLAHLLPDLMAQSALEGGLRPVSEILAAVMPTDYVSIAWRAGTTAHEDRASMAIGDKRLVENRRRWPVADTTTRALRRGKMIITPNLPEANTESSGRQDPWELRLGMRSRVVVPILSGPEIIGTLTVAHRQIAAYGEEHSELLATMAGILSLWFDSMAARSARTRWENADRFVQSLHSDPWQWSDEQAVLAEAQRLLDVSGLRLFRMNTVAGELLEVAAVGRVAPNGTPRRLAMSDLPWHRHAMDCVRPLSVNQDDPELLMTDDEAARTMTPGIKTAYIVPVVFSGETLGFLDVMETRHPDRKRLDLIDHAVLREATEHLGRHWAGRQVRLRGGDASAMPGVDTATLRSLHREIVNPITSIIGSVELLRYKERAMSDESARYLKTIERSAMRIQESTARFYDRVPQQSVSAGTSGLDSESARLTAHQRDFTRPASLGMLDHNGPSVAVPIDEGIPVLGGRLAGDMRGI